MDIGFIGLGKLGLPCAAAMSVKLDQPIFGYDVNPAIKGYIESKKVPYVEDQIESYLKQATVTFENSISDVILKSETVFLAIQTPHEEKFEGITPVPDEKQDFDYSYLIECNRQIKEVLIKNPDKKINIVIISTVLPGTTRKHILPIYEDIKDRVAVYYNPYFIAMGTTIQDFLYPEFVLVGKEDSQDPGPIWGIYNGLTKSPIKFVAYESAELAKVSYNTFIGMKIIFANALTEITEKLGGDAGEVVDVLSLGNKRIISSAYMKPGMGDGGGCHPRDQIAMSWLAEEIGMSSDIFGFVAKTRDAQTKKMAERLKAYSEHLKLDLVILGESYKKNIGLTIGSPSKLLQYYLDELGVSYEVIDPYIEGRTVEVETKKLFFVATPHDKFKTYVLPIGSFVVDPWGSIADPTVDWQYSTHNLFIGKKHLHKSWSREIG